MDVWRFLDIPTSDNRDVKTSIYSYSPFEKTLYIDCDTFIISDITDVFRFLDFFDLSIRPKEHALGGTTQFAATPILDGTLNLSRCPHWNSGVMAFRKNDSVERFFSHWNEEYHVIGAARDQVSLVEALFRCDCQILPLDSRWNLSSQDRREWASPGVKIIHYMSEHDSFIAKKILEMSKDAGFEHDTEVSDFLRSKRKQRARKLGAMKYAMYKAGQDLQLFLHRPQKLVRFV